MFLVVNSPLQFWQAITCMFCWMCVTSEQNAALSSDKMTEGKNHHMLRDVKTYLPKDTQLQNLPA